MQFKLASIHLFPYCTITVLIKLCFSQKSFPERFVECIPVKDLLQEPARNLESVLQVILQKLHFVWGRIWDILPQSPRRSIGIIRHLTKLLKVNSVNTCNSTFQCPSSQCSSLRDLFEQSLSRFLVSENGLFLTPGSGTSSGRNKNLRTLLYTKIPLISGKYGLRNRF